MPIDSSDKTFYVTTPIYYVNAKPHLGSLYSTLLADVAARWHALQGKETFMLTGTDEHGQKVAEAAEKNGKTPQVFVDSLVGSFKGLWDTYHINYNHFIRTTDEYHVKAVQGWIEKLQVQGDIYKDVYEGWYCTSSEAFLTEKDLEFRQKGEAPLSLLSGKPAQWVSEECFFFRLSAYQDKLLEFYKNNPYFITPRERLNEVVSFVEGGLKDLSISRKTIDWGIPFPGAEDHVTYVWADALNNYITSIGYGDVSRNNEFEKWWPADVHILGKDISRFHAIYWPAFLMASGLNLPKKLLVHGWIKVDGEKMSKSRGNVVDPYMLAEQYGVESVRYYLTRYMAITQDSTFSSTDLEQKINADLANDCGNLLNRMLTLALKNNLQHVPAVQEWSVPSQQLHESLQETLKQAQHEMKNFYFNRAYGHVWRFINAVNAYFHAQEPWKLAKNDPEKFAEVISATCHSLYAIGVLVWPIMPEKMSELLGALGKHVEADTNMFASLTQPWTQAFVLKKIDPLFVKHEPHEKEVTMEEKKVEENPTPDNTISIDDVVKVELRVGQITVVEDMPKAERIYKFTVDFGLEYGQRIICAGLKQHFAFDELQGKKCVFVFNLKPRKLLGVESQGMLMTAADTHGKPVPVTVGVDTPLGTRLK